MREFIVGNEDEIINNPDNKPTTAFVIVESVKGYMLLYNKYRQVWELTGGIIDEGESPKDCVIRECREESNQNISELKFVGLAKYDTMNAAIYYSFLNEEKLFIENAEIKELCWWKLGEELAEMDFYSIELIRQRRWQCIPLSQADMETRGGIVSIVYQEINSELLEVIAAKYGEIAKNHIHLDDGFSLAALHEGVPVGFISAYTKELPPPLYDIKDAYIDIIEVDEPHRRKGIARHMITATEKWAMKTGFSQIRAWSSQDKVEAIPMWHALCYGMCPAKIWLEWIGEAVDGYYVAKVLNREDVSVTL